MTQNTTNLNIPFPDENDDNWWDVEANISTGRMATLDKLLCASLQRSMFCSDMSLGSGSLTWNSPFTTVAVSWANMGFTGPSGGHINLTMGDSVLAGDGDWVWIMLPEMPWTTTVAGVMQAGPIIPWENPLCFPVGQCQNKKFHPVYK